MSVKKVRWYHYLLGTGLGIAMLISGVSALQVWHVTGRMPLHHGFHRSVSYANDPSALAYEFGVNVFLIFLGLAVFALFVFGALSRWRRRP